MKSTTGTNYAPCSVDGTARIGLSPFQLRGIPSSKARTEQAAPTTPTNDGQEGSQEGADKPNENESGDGDDGDKFDADKAREKIR